MNFDLAISDFDGTLLRRDDTISPRTLAAIDAFRAAGGTFCVSTGRAFASIRQRLGELGLGGNVPVMCCQGALTRECESGKTIAATPMSRDAAAAFLRKAEELDLVCQFYTPDAVYVPDNNEINEIYFRKNRFAPVVAGKLSQFVLRCEAPVLKTLCYIEPKRREELLRVFGEIEDAQVFASNPVLIEAVATTAGKENGLKQTCAHLGVDPRRSVAFGDELNDVAMLKAAGLGVAMGNAVPAAKAAADTVTADCDDDGVARVLEQIVAGEL